MNMREQICAGISRAERIARHCLFRSEFARRICRLEWLGSQRPEQRHDHSNVQGRRAKLRATGSPLIRAARSSRLSLQPRTKSPRPSIQRRRRSRSRVGTIPHSPRRSAPCRRTVAGPRGRSPNGTPEHPVEQDLAAIEDFDVHIGGRGVEHDQPRERLKSRVG